MKAKGKVVDNSKLLPSKHPIINWFIHNHVAANLLMFGILLTGLYMVGFFGLFGQTAKLRLESFPAIEEPLVTITATINGSTPEDVEQGVTDKIEEALQGIQGVDKITSESSADKSIVRVQAGSDYDMDKLYDDVKTQVDTIGNLPAEVEKVLVTRRALQPPIAWVTLHGNTSERTLKKEANRLKSRLLESPYIEKIYIDGERPSEISIEISEKTLKEYGLTLQQVASAINLNSLDLSSGALETEQGELTLRIKSQAKTQSDYENIIIRSNSDGSLVRLGDIAKVTDGFIEQSIYVAFNDEPSLTLRLKTGKNANVVEADKSAKAIIEEFTQTLPDNLSISTWNNLVSFVKDRIDLFVRNSATGIVLVFLLLTLFLNLRLAFWVALGIPVALSGALICMSFFDISINMITLFGFILVLGIVVDDAIVIGESIYTWKKRTNNADNATLIGVSRVSVAATFGVLTTVAAFLPLTQISGTVGAILGQIGTVVIFCLLFSLLESKLILPSHLYRTQVASIEDEKGNLWSRVQASVSHGLEVLVEKSYLPVLAIALRQRYFTVLIFISMLVLTAGLILGGIVPISIMPKVESKSISLTVEMDNSTSVEETIAMTKRAAKALREADKQLMKEGNTDKPNVTHISSFNLNNTTFMVKAGLAGAETRKLSGPQIANRWREVMGDIEGAKSVDYSARQRWTKADIEIQILGSNRETQRQAGIALANEIKRIEGIKEVINSQDETGNEIRIALKPEASVYGISKAQLAQTVRAAFYGQQAERLQRGNEEVRVMVRYPKSERKSLSDLYQLNIRTDKGLSVPIASVATLSYDRSSKMIEHLDGQRTVSVLANINKEKTTGESVMATINETILPTIQNQYDVQIRFGGETEEDEKSKNSMILGFIISLVMIFVLLAIPLKSYTRPVIIMMAIPFGVIGAVLGHLFLGMTMSMLSVFGIIALSGVVVNDSLLLLTTIQQHRDEGMDIHEAITVTGLRRFRPVILTSITTFVGLMPMLFETSFQAQFLIPMAVSLGFGILFATGITLILIPIVYAIFDDIKRMFFVEVKE
ncbi:MAG: efflux RND transporter permease subunit [Gammaproteobacteria bacterium]|nr:efflux RND transporter permease subunit [Gammaproteobacteria bacterium]